MFLKRELRTRLGMGVRQGWGEGGRGRGRVEGVEERWKGRERLDEVAYVSNVMRL